MPCHADITPCYAIADVIYATLLVLIRLRRRETYRLFFLPRARRLCRYVGCYARLPCPPPTPLSICYAITLIIIMNNVYYICRLPLCYADRVATLRHCHFDDIYADAAAIMMLPDAFAAIIMIFHAYYYHASALFRVSSLSSSFR